MVPTTWMSPAVDFFAFKAVCTVATGAYVGRSTNRTICSLLSGVPWTSGTDSARAVADSTILRTLPFGTTVRPSDDNATRNSRYASCGVIEFGAMIVTFLPRWMFDVSNMKLRHVKPIAHVTRSLTSVSGLNVTLTAAVLSLQ